MLLRRTLISNLFGTLVCARKFLSKKVSQNKKKTIYRFPELSFHVLVFPFVVSRVRYGRSGYLRIGQSRIVPLRRSSVFETNKNVILVNIGAESD